ncbi:hypothetical protein ACOMHN_000782 [Nucella lapillus]
MGGYATKLQKYAEKSTDWYDHDTRNTQRFQDFTKDCHDHLFPTSLPRLQHKPIQNTPSPRHRASQDNLVQQSQVHDLQQLGIQEAGIHSNTSS